MRGSSPRSGGASTASTTPTAAGPAGGGGGVLQWWFKSGGGSTGSTTEQTAEVPPAQKTAAGPEGYKAALSLLLFDNYDSTKSGHSHVATTENFGGAAVSTLASLKAGNIKTETLDEVNRINKSALTALIIGPADSSYENGLFEFDILLGPNYPVDAPLVKFKSSGCRFSPNLKEDGTVCISLLGTWHGSPDEGWQSQGKNKSTVLQLLVSIQSHILCSDPYFCEPGFDKEIGTAEGTRKSAEYNENVRALTAQYGILAPLKRKTPHPVFANVIAEHFSRKAKLIKEQLDAWTKTTKGLTGFAREIRPLLDNQRGSSGAEFHGPACVLGGGSGKGPASLEDVRSKRAARFDAPMPK